MMKRREITDPVDYDSAIDYVCESMGLDLGVDANRRKAHFRLEWAVRDEKIVCALINAQSGRPYTAIRTFSGGVGWLDLANVGGRIEETIYEAEDLRRAFPIREERIGHVVPPSDAMAVAESTKPKNVRQPSMVWVKVGLELGIYLQRGGDPNEANKFVNKLLEERGWAFDKSVVSRHVKELVGYCTEHGLL